MSPITRTLTTLSRQSLFDLSLYLVANKPSYPDLNIFLRKIESAVKGGISCVQYRDYQDNRSFVIKTIKEIQQVTGDTPLFINTLDPIQVIQETSAQGIYLERETPTLFEVRKGLGRDIVVGVPIKTWGDLYSIQPHLDEVDYLSVKVFPSRKTCPQNNYLWGIAGLQEVRLSTQTPIVAIGGLTKDNVAVIYPELYPSDGIAMAGGLMDQENIQRTIQEIRSIECTTRRKI